MTATLPSYDLFTPEAADDPQSLLRRISAETRVSWSPDLNAYMLTRHDDILTALKDPRLVTGNITQGLDRLTEAEQAELLPLRESVNRWMGHTTEEGHHRFQKLLKRYFTPATVNGLRPAVRSLTTQLLDAVEPQGGMDTVQDLAYLLPAYIIADMFGMPPADRHKLRAWSPDLGAIFQVADAALLRASQRSILEMQDYLRGLVIARRADPQDDLLSMFVAAEREGLVDEDEIVANCVLLLFAGHETSAGLIVNGLNLLLANPDQLDLLKSDPSLTPSAVEEMLRCGGSVDFVARVATQDTLIAGHTFTEGDFIYLALRAGNRDPAVFPNPDKFDITRQNNRHTAFGMGSYYCLGAALARVETDECFRLLLNRFPNIRIGKPEPEYARVLPLGRRITSFTVEF
jgi:cytochrome P450